MMSWMSCHREDKRWKQARERVATVDAGARAAARVLSGGGERGVGEDGADGDAAVQAGVNGHAIQLVAVAVESSCLFYLETFKAVAREGALRGAHHPSRMLCGVPHQVPYPAELTRKLLHTPCPEQPLRHSSCAQDGPLAG